MVIMIEDSLFVYDIANRWKEKNGRTPPADIDALFDSEYLNIGLKSIDGNYHKVIDKRLFMLAIMKYGFEYTIKKRVGRKRFYGN